VELRSNLIIVKYYSNLFIVLNSIFNMNLKDFIYPVINRVSNIFYRENKSLGDSELDPNPNLNESLKRWRKQVEFSNTARVNSPTCFSPYFDHTYNQK